VARYKLLSGEMWVEMSVVIQTSLHPKFSKQCWIAFWAGLSYIVLLIVFITCVYKMLSNVLAIALS